MPENMETSIEDIRGRTIKRFGTRKYDEPEKPDTIVHYLISNEACIPDMIEYVKDSRGVALGVGLDQMLDIAAGCPNIEEIYIVDNSHYVTNATRALLEIGRLHHLRTGQYPTCREFLDYLTPEKVYQTIDLLRDHFTGHEMDAVLKALRFTMNILPNESTGSDTPLALHYFLTKKSEHPERSSWVSSDDNLKHVLSMYLDGRITVAQADLAGDSAMAEIGKDLSVRGKEISIVYVSNAEYYLKRAEKYYKYIGNLFRLHLPKTAKIIRSSMGYEGMAVPAFIASDKYLGKHTIEWSYEIQTWGDYLEFWNNTHKYTYSDNVTRPVSTPDSRLEAMYDGADPKEMNVRHPRKGLILAGF